MKGEQLNFKNIFAEANSQEQTESSPQEQADLPKESEPVEPVEESELVEPAERQEPVEPVEESVEPLVEPLAEPLVEPLAEPVDPSEELAELPEVTAEQAKAKLEEADKTARANRFVFLPTDIKLADADKEKLKTFLLGPVERIKAEHFIPFGEEINNYHYRFKKKEQELKQLPADGPEYKRLYNFLVNPVWFEEEEYQPIALMYFRYQKIRKEEAYFRKAEAEYQAKIAKEDLKKQKQANKEAREQAKQDKIIEELKKKAKPVSRHSKLELSPEDEAIFQEDETENPWVDLSPGSHKLSVNWSRKRGKQK